MSGARETERRRTPTTTTTTTTKTTTVTATITTTTTTKTTSVTATITTMTTMNDDSWQNLSSRDKKVAKNLFFEQGCFDRNGRSSFRSIPSQSRTNCLQREAQKMSKLMSSKAFSTVFHEDRSTFKITLAISCCLQNVLLNITWFSFILACPQGSFYFEPLSSSSCVGRTKRGRKSNFTEDDRN